MIQFLEISTQKSQNPRIFLSTFDPSAVSRHFATSEVESLILTFQEAISKSQGFFQCKTRRFFLNPLDFL